MSENQALSLVYIVLVMVLVGSALANRRLPGRTLAKMAVAWVLIFALGFALVALWRA